MLINEVCKKCRLTKKAIEYYVEQQLVRPEILENGYRNFPIGDVERLKKIAILRRLGLSVQRIKEVLDGGGLAALYKDSENKRIEIEAEKAKQAFIQQLAEKQDWEYTSSQLEVLEKSQTILQRLLNVFPGYYGKYISLHFARYLNEPIVSDEQQEAFETVIDFLDHVSLELPSDLQQYLDEITKDFDEAFVENVFANMNDVISDTEKYMAENKELLERYIKAMVGRSAKVAENERVRKKRELDALLARDRELDALFERLYEDNVSGKIDDARFAKMSKRYEQEQGENAGRIKALRMEVKKLDEKRMDVEDFLETVRRYTDATTITKRMVAELIDHIEVYPAVKEDGVTNQRVTIHYNCIGVFEVPDRRKIPERDILLETRRGVALSYAPAGIAV